MVVWSSLFWDIIRSITNHLCGPVVHFIWRYIKLKCKLCFVVLWLSLFKDIIRSSANLVFTRCIVVGTWSREYQLSSSSSSSSSTRCDFVAYGQGMQKTLQLFLPSADYKVVCRRPWNHFFPLPPLQTLLKLVTKSLIWHSWWPLKHVCHVWPMWVTLSQSCCHAVTLSHCHAVTLSRCQRCHTKKSIFVEIYGCPLSQRID
jgi:hypothetical protein